MIAPFWCETPEIEDILLEAVYKEPPIPTPPETIKAPVVVEVETVVPVTAIPAEVRRLLPMVIPDPVESNVPPVEAVLTTVPIKYLVTEDASVTTVADEVAEPTVNELPNAQAIPEDPVVTKIEPAAPE